MERVRKQLMQESYSNETLSFSEHEIFSQLRILPNTPFFVRLDGRRFQAVSEAVEAENPFDERFAKAMTASAEAVFQSGFNPALAYIASYDISLLFLSSPFERRIEKIDSVLSGIISSAFSLNLQKFFKKSLIVGFDSRIVIISVNEMTEYLDWRQRNAWRNHNNAYDYWVLRKIGHKTSDAAKMLKGLKA